MTGQDTQRLASQRAEMVAAAREHSAAVARHLERMAVRLRSHASSSGPTEPGTPREAGPAGPEAAGVGQSATLRQSQVHRPPVGDLSRLLLADADIDSLLRTVLTLARNSVRGCDGVSVTLLRGGRVETASASGQAVARADRAQYPRHEGPCYEAATSGATRVAHSLPDPRWPAFSEQALGLGWAAVASVPLQTRAGLLGALNLYSRAPGVFGSPEVVVAEALAEHIAVALTNARDFQRQQSTAASLQRSLLPPQLPELPGLSFAARYQPASAGINVGGDWYDVIGLPSGEVGLVIGDVAGHGLAAATTMAQLRTAVRAYALEGHDPIEVIELVDQFLQRVEPEGYATCCYVALDPATSTARWCNAGHPDPLVLTPDGFPRPLTGSGTGRRPALGVPHAVAGLRAETEVLPPCGRLLLFTDGLVERRRESLDVGLDRLARAAVALLTRGGELQRWCDEVVLAQLGDREVGDDVAVLAVQLVPEGAATSRLADHEGAPRVAG